MEPAMQRSLLSWEVSTWSPSSFSCLRQARWTRPHQNSRSNKEAWPHEDSRCSFQGGAVVRRYHALASALLYESDGPAVARQVEHKDLHISRLAHRRDHDRRWAHGSWQ